MSDAIAIPDATSFQKKSREILSTAWAIEITSDAQFMAAADFLKGLKGHLKELDATFDASIAAAHEAHKKMLVAKKTHAEPILQAGRILKGKIAAYQIEVDKRRKEEVARRELEAKKQEAETGEIPIQAAVLLDAPKLKGVSFREKWTAEVTDFSLLLQAIVGKKAPVNLVQPDETAIRKFAESTRGAIQIPGLMFERGAIVSVSGGQTDVPISG